MSVLRFLIPGYVVGVVFGWAVALYFGALIGVFAAWIGGAAFTLLFAFIWHRASRNAERERSAREDAATEPRAVQTRAN